MPDTEPRTAPPASAGSAAVAFLDSMRVTHWIKNAFVAAPILFGGRTGQPRAWAECLSAVVAFCLLSSGIYLLNDVMDRTNDRAHPTKRFRPVAAGRLSVPAAVGGGVGLLAVGMAIILGVGSWTYDPQRTLAGLGVLVWASAYVALNLLYCVWLKRLAVVDVIVVSLGFVLRAMAGASAVAVAISPWLVVCTLSLCLFIALTKRRSEITELPGEVAAQTRRVNGGYLPADVEQMVSVSMAMAILTYTLYCLAPGTVRRIHSAHMVWTIPLVIYGIFRYSQITRRAGQNDPVKALVHDGAMWIVLIAYVALTALILQFGACPLLAGILDMDLLVK